MNAKKFLITVIIIISVGIFTATAFDAAYYSSADEISLPDRLVASSLGGAFNLPEDSGSSEVFLPKTETLKNKISKIAAPSYFGRLAIPKIKVDAKVEEVGISKKGNMAVPTTLADVGWYKYGTLPGETGSAIIAGHVDNRFALPAVFADLKNLEIGDDVYITKEGGDKRLHFVVNKVSTYDFDASADEVFTEEGDKLLKLITCTGIWNSEFKTHNQRLVVTATLVE